MSDWAAVLTPEWLLGALWDVFLIGLLGVVIWKLQDGWIRRRIRAEKDFEILRDVYRQLSVVVVEIGVLGTLLQSGKPGDQGRANVLLPEVTDRAYRMSEDARLVFHDTILQAQFDIITAALGSMEPGTVIGKNRVDPLQEAAFALRRMVLERMDFGAKP